MQFSVCGRPEPDRGSLDLTEVVCMSATKMRHHRHCCFDVSLGVAGFGVSRRCLAAIERDLDYFNTDIWHQQ